MLWPSGSSAHVILEMQNQETLGGHTFIGKIIKILEAINYQAIVSLEANIFIDTENGID